MARMLFCFGAVMFVAGTASILGTGCPPANKDIQKTVLKVLSGDGCRGCAPEDDVTILLPGDVPLVMVKIPADTFQMGRYAGEQDSIDSEDPQHQVSLPADFWMGKYEVTKAQWQAVMDTTPWSGQNYMIDDPDSPAVYISWDDAKAFIASLNTYTGEAFRLPSESEWEYACRAGSTTRFYWGDDPDYSLIYNYAWWKGNAWDADQRYAHRTGLKQPNVWGLYDMGGNAWELCEDDWHNGYTDAPADGSAWINSPRSIARIQRGGSVEFDGKICRSAGRAFTYLTTKTGFLGFRLAKS